SSGLGMRRLVAAHFSQSQVKSAEMMPTAVFWQLGDGTAKPGPGFPGSVQEQSCHAAVEKHGHAFGLLLPKRCSLFALTPVPGQRRLFVGPCRPPFSRDMR